MRLDTKIAAALLGLAFAGITVADANAYTRNGGGTGPRGHSYTSQGSGSCSGSSCRSSQSVTGPRGNSGSRANSGSCSGGSCTTEHKLTGPRGSSATRGNTFSR